jgi:hypothetical protein
VLDWGQELEAAVRTAELGSPLCELLPGQVLDEVRDATDIFATKGLLARLLRQAANRTRGASVTSFVTNPGLLELPVHRAYEVPSFVPWAEWCPYVRSVLGREPTVLSLHPSANETENLVEIAPLPLRQRGEKAILFAASDDGHPWLDLLRCSAPYIGELPVVFVSVRNPGLLAMVRELARSSGFKRFACGTWIPETTLSQWLTHAAVEGCAIAVTKPGPATVRTLARTGTPLVLWDASLPFEDWVMRSAHTSSTHRCAHSIEDVVDALRTFAAGLPLPHSDPRWVPVPVPVNELVLR